MRSGVQYKKVINVDKEGGFIDVSNLDVRGKVAKAKAISFNKATVVDEILTSTARSLSCSPLELYQAFGWDLYDNFDHAYDGFKQCLIDEESVLSKVNIT